MLENICINKLCFYLIFNFRSSLEFKRRLFSSAKSKHLHYTSIFSARNSHSEKFIYKIFFCSVKEKEETITKFFSPF